MSQLALHIWVTGRVQGVFFRQSTKEFAHQKGVKGWVRNLPDGRVEAILCGENRAVRDVEAWIHHGPPQAEVLDVAVKEIEPEAHLNEFYIEH